MSEALPRRTSTFVRLSLVAASAAALGGCVGVHSSDAPIPLRDNRPNPEPVAGYRVVCETVPGPFDVFFADRVTGCQQVIVPRERRVVVRAKG